MISLFGGFGANFFSNYAIAGDPSTIYRVVEARRSEFLDALKAVSPGRVESMASGRSGGSRLQKYFEITHKTVKGPEIEMEIQVQKRILPEGLVKFTSITLRLKELPPVDSNPRFQTEFILSPTAHVSSMMTVLPDEKGCLLRLDIQQTTLPLWMFKAAMDLLLKLDLASTSPTGRT